MVLVTVPNHKTATEIAGGLVKQKLAACVNIVRNMQSLYCWKGKIEKSSEELLIIKTMSFLSSKLITYVKKNHPYSVAEIIALDITKGSKSYLDWISAVCNPKKGKNK